MRKLMLTFCLLTIVPVSGRAEDGSLPRGYVFFAPGMVERETTLHLGVGGEVPIYKGLGMGGELGYLGPANYFGEGFGILSANATYDFPRATSGKLGPFATGGYSLGFRSGSINGFNYGIGMNYWIVDRIGLRVEFREHVFDRTHFHGFRIGWIFH